MEYLDLYDEYGRKTGKTVLRGQPHPEGTYIRSVLVAIFGPDGRMLIQQRSDKKQHWAGLWDFSCCGAVSSGEDTRTAGMREVREELGLTVDLHHVRPSFTNAFSTGFNDTFLLTLEPDPSALVLQQEEVQAVRWADEAEVLQLLQEGRFIPYKPAWVSLLFATHRRPGTIEG